MDKNLKKWNENKARDEASYLLQTAARMVSWIDHNQQLNFALKTLQQ